jgi:hypothetical protein
MPWLKGERELERSGRRLVELLGRTLTLQESSDVPPRQLDGAAPIGCELAFVNENRVFAKYHYGSVGIIQISAYAGNEGDALCRIQELETLRSPHLGTSNADL